MVPEFHASCDGSAAPVDDGAADLVYRPGDGLPVSRHRRHGGPFPLLIGAVCCVGSVVHADQVIQSFNDLAKPVGFWAPEGTSLQECFAPDSGNMTGNWETIFTPLTVTERTDLQSAVSHYVASQAQGLGPTSVGYIRGSRFR